MVSDLIRPEPEREGPASSTGQADLDAAVARQLADLTRQVSVLDPLVRELVPKCTDLEAIVRDLADTSSTDLWDSEYDWCRICNEAPHADDCAFARAQAWVERNGHE